MAVDNGSFVKYEDTENQHRYLDDQMELCFNSYKGSDFLVDYWDMLANVRKVSKIPRVVPCIH